MHPVDHAYAVQYAALRGAGTTSGVPTPLFWFGAISLFGVLMWVTLKTDDMVFDALRRST